jgi:hypothetical protein
MRSLRIGVVLRGLLVEERLFTGPVTLGQSLRCALSVPTDGMPREHALFTVDQGRFVLHLTPGMETRLAGVEDGVLGPGARGRIMLGDASILFQEIATPPSAPRPQLPASIRGTLGDRIDRRLAAIIGASLLVHIGIAAYAWSTDRALPPLGMSSAMRDYVPETVADVELPDIPPQNVEAPGVAAPVTPAQTPAPIVHPTHVTTAHGPAQPPRLAEDDALRMASILTGANETPNGPGTMHARQPGADLDKQLEDASHHTVAIGNNDHTSRTGREHIGTDPSGPLVDDPTLTRTTHREETPVRITLERPKPDQPTTLTPDSVVDKIRDAYMNGLERCYRKGLVADATLSGKVPISFTVTSHGQVADPEAIGVNEQLDACITGQMTSWHFTIPRDKDGEPTDVSFHVVLALRPS